MAKNSKVQSTAYLSDLEIANLRKCMNKVADKIGHLPRPVLPTSSQSTLSPSSTVGNVEFAEVSESFDFFKFKVSDFGISLGTKESNCTESRLFKLKLPNGIELEFFK